MIPLSSQSDEVLDSKNRETIQIDDAQAIYKSKLGCFYAAEVETRKSPLDSLIATLKGRKNTAIVINTMPKQEIQTFNTKLQAPVFIYYFIFTLFSIIYSYFYCFIVLIFFNFLQVIIYIHFVLL